MMLAEVRVSVSRAHGAATSRKLSGSMDLNELSAMSELNGWTAPLNLPRKLNEPPARSILTTRAEGGNWPTYSCSGVM